MSLRFLSLFAGVGGFDLGLERAGWQCAGQVEIDPFCNKVLAKHWPNVWRHSDINGLSGELIRNQCGRLDAIVGGFPCQDVSIANPSGLGLSGARSGLWREMLRVIKDVGPRWVIGENVTNLLNRGLETCIDGLEAEGYEVRAFDIPACAAGLPTMERHIWIVASTNSQRQEGSIEQALSRFGAFTREFSGSYPRDFGRWAVPASRVFGVGERIPNGMDRVSALGNAVPPQIPEIIGRAILEMEVA